jgi:hypothetical protein
MPRRRWDPSHQHRSSAGQDLVEYALILPLLLLLLLGIAEFALIIFSHDTIANAAREGARYGSIHPTDTGGICNRARGLTEGMDQGALRCTVTLPPGRLVRVRIEYDYDWLTGLIMQAASGHDTLPLRSVATMRIE